MDGLENRTVRKTMIRERPRKKDKLNVLVTELETLIESGFTGYVKINYSQGSIGRVEKFEEILKDLRTNV